MDVVELLRGEKIELIEDLRLASVRNILLTQKIKRLQSAAREFIERLERVTSSSEFASVFVMAETHGMGYAGEQFRTKESELYRLVNEVDDE